MRAIVKAAVQRELGIALIPVDEKLAFHMTGRVMVSRCRKSSKTHLKASYRRWSMRSPTTHGYRVSSPMSAP